MANTKYVIPENYEYITKSETLSGVDSNLMGYYFLVILSGIVIDGNWGKSMQDLYEVAKEKELLFYRYGAPISYRSVYMSINAALKNSGLGKSPSKFLGEVVNEIMQNKLNSKKTTD